MKLTLKECRSPPKKVKHKRLPLPRAKQLVRRQSALVILIILGEEILKVLWPETTLVIVAHAVAAVLGLVHVPGIESEEWVREDGGNGRVAEEAVDDEDSAQAEWNGPSPCAEAGICVVGPDDAVAVTVEVVYVLDDHLRLQVSTSDISVSSEIRSKCFSKQRVDRQLTV